MSFDVNWSNLIGDGSINDSIRDFLDHQFKTLSLPPYIDSINVTKLSLGNTPPEITIRHVGDPFREFYEEEGQESELNKPHAVRNSSQSDSSDDEDREQAFTSQEVNEGNTSYMTSMLNSESGSSIQINRKLSDPLGFLKNNNGSLNSLHSYSVNSMVGLGNLTGHATEGGKDTPAEILNQQSHIKSNSHGISSVQENGDNKPSSVSENDIQFIVDIKYQGDLFIETSVKLLVNFPYPSFISLPIKLNITDLVVHSVASIAYLKKSVFISFLCDIDDNISEYLNNANSASQTMSGFTSGGNFVDYVSGPNNREGIDIVKKVKIESEIGEVEHNVLRNVGKVEKFLIEQLRNILREELAWPSWVCLDLNDNDDEEDGNMKHHSI